MVRYCHNRGQNMGTVRVFYQLRYCWAKPLDILVYTMVGVDRYSYSHVIIPTTRISKNKRFNSLLGATTQTYMYYYVTQVTKKLSNSLFLNNSE